MSEREGRKPKRTKKVARKLPRGSQKTHPSSQTVRVAPPSLPPWSPEDDADPNSGNEIQKQPQSQTQTQTQTQPQHLPVALPVPPRGTHRDSPNPPAAPAQAQAHQLAAVPVMHGGGLLVPYGLQGALTLQPLHANLVPLGMQGVALQPLLTSGALTGASLLAPQAALLGGGVAGSLAVAAAQQQQQAQQQQPPPPQQGEEVGQSTTETPKGNVEKPPTEQKKKRKKKKQVATNLSQLETIDLTGEKEEKKRKQPDSTATGLASGQQMLPGDSDAATSAKKAKNSAAESASVSASVADGAYDAFLSSDASRKPAPTDAASDAASVMVSIRAKPPSSATTASKSPKDAPPEENCASLEWGVNQLQKRISRLDKYATDASMQKELDELRAKNAELRGIIAKDQKMYDRKLAEGNKAESTTIASFEAQCSAQLKKFKEKQEAEMGLLKSKVDRAKAREAKLMGYKDKGERVLLSTNAHRMKAQASSDAAEANNIYAWREVQHLRSMLRAEREEERAFHRLQLEELARRLERSEEDRSGGVPNGLGGGGKANRRPSSKPADVAGMMMVDLLKRDVVNLECMTDCLRAEERQRLDE